jgi:hypothetical protein
MIFLYAIKSVISEQLLGDGEMGRWGDGEMGRWGGHCVRVAGGDGEISTNTPKPQNPNPENLFYFLLFTFYLIVGINTILERLSNNCKTSLYLSNI